MLSSMTWDLYLYVKYSVTYMSYLNILEKEVTTKLKELCVLSIVLFVNSFMRIH